jgi:hypothetical protein
VIEFLRVVGAIGIDRAKLLATVDLTAVAE